MWDANEGRRSPRNCLECSSVQPEGAIQFDFYRLLGTNNLPRIRMPQPAVSLLVLPTVLDELPEDSILVLKAISHRRQLHSGHGIKKARGQTTQTTVS